MVCIHACIQFVSFLLSTYCDELSYVTHAVIIVNYVVSVSVDSAFLLGVGVYFHRLIEDESVMLSCTWVSCFLCAVCN